MVRFPEIAEALDVGDSRLLGRFVKAGILEPERRIGVGPRGKQYWWSRADLVDADVAGRLLKVCRLRTQVGAVLTQWRECGRPGAWVGLADGEPYYWDTSSEMGDDIRAGVAVVAVWTGDGRGLMS